MIAYRDRLAAEWKLNLIYGQNAVAFADKRTFPDGAVDRLTCCSPLKTEALKKTLSGEWPRFKFDHATGGYDRDSNTDAFTGVIVGARADEEGSRSKERYFSPRDQKSAWDVADSRRNSGTSTRRMSARGPTCASTRCSTGPSSISGRYIEAERIPVIDLYFDTDGTGSVTGRSVRAVYQPVKSSAATAREIVVELMTGRFANVAERSGRAQDAEDGGGLETLRRDGYM